MTMAKVMISLERKNHIIYIPKTQYKKQTNKQTHKTNKQTKVVCAYLSKKDVGYIIPTLNCYQRNGQLKDPEFMHHKLYHRSQYQYSQHLILWVVLNISTTLLRTWFIRVQSQNPIKQVGLTIHTKTSLVRNSDNIECKTQKSCNENASLKSTYLLQTQRFTES